MRHFCDVPSSTPAFPVYQMNVIVCLTKLDWIHYIRDNTGLIGIILIPILHRASSTVKRFTFVPIVR